MVDPAALRKALGKYDEFFGLFVHDEEVIFAAARELLRLMETAETVWFCNSTLVPRCREDKPDPMGLGGHDSCQWVYIIPLRDNK